MRSEFQSFNFPLQRIPNSEKTEQWSAEFCDFIIAQGIGMKQEDDIETKYRILHGDIPDKFYKKILNPYNATKEQYKRFPATMRNFNFTFHFVLKNVGSDTGCLGLVH